MNEFPQFLDYARRQRDCWTDIVTKLEAVEPLASTSTNGAEHRKTDGRTDGATRVPRRSAVRSLPDDPDFEKKTERLLAALRESSPQRTGDAMKAAKLSFPTKGYQARFLKKLAEAGRIVRSGNARGATVGLPGKLPAKERL